MNRILAFIYGVICYLAFLASYFYFVLFLENLVVPKSIDAGTAAPAFEALVINLLLITLFALQHSVMARQGFKQWWTKIVPKPLERSTYVLLSSILLTLLIWQWRPLPAAIWTVENEVGRTLLYGLYGLGFYFEERDLVRQFGERYLVYREQVPKLIPLPTGKIALTEAKANTRIEEPVGV